ncbi:dihydroorotate dehydrogenase [Candidatus Woesearchaeota archaeon]|nr:dihydroorotate dehydrogenase [Candidatus Woesearchaeota archaeon]
MLSATLCGVSLDNPTILASGILGVSKLGVARMGREGAGAVTLKSLCHEERKGHPAPNMFVIDDGMLNAVGLPGQGIDNAVKEFGRLDDLPVPVIGSIFGYKIADFGIVAEKMASLKPAMIEVDVSCPHMDYDTPFYADSSALAKITKLVKKKAKGIPVSLKLSPNVPNIAELAQSCEKAGADCITAINTASAMKIDIEVRKPILGNKVGGLSGPALKPIAVRCVYEIFGAVKIPIIGTGGVSDGKDAIEMIMAGATAVGIGTAAYYRGPEVFRRVTDEMKAWMKEHGVSALDEIRGAAYK